VAQQVGQLKLSAVIVCTFFVAPLAHAQTAPEPIISGFARTLPVTARNGMVVSQEETASRIGVAILKAGGNAVDAAVATGFALAVTLPRAGNLGGGGFMLVHLAQQKTTIAIDYRETAPGHVSRCDGRLRAREIAVERARGRHAGHGGGTCAGA
jgi:gamma-glutamyltranspeptidase/glutathione hydrolase